MYNVVYYMSETIKLLLKQISLSTPTIYDQSCRLRLFNMDDDAAEKRTWHSAVLRIWVIDRQLLNIARSFHRPMINDTQVPELNTGSECSEIRLLVDSGNAKRRHEWVVAKRFFESVT